MFGALAFRLCCLHGLVPAPLKNLVTCLVQMRIVIVRM
ncbi:hypothetical protein ACS15_0167 [Ralstonia insidiosa]|uniref:Uncharacterized protein n=1 Tax=Ralstonia insidiosa TaxID=190721 RepID=A0AAC9BHH1_9RALS|nr:hypothetical protein ACS15_0167 [Ralstonia insidiosa]